jgi:acyl carrier protein
MNQDISEPLQDAHEQAVIKDAIAQWLIRYIEGLGIAPGEVNALAQLEDYGMDSLAAVELSGQLSTWLGCEIDAMLVYQYSTIDQLSEALARQGSIRASFGKRIAPSVPDFLPLPLAGEGLGEGIGP